MVRWGIEDMNTNDQIQKYESFIPTKLLAKSARDKIPSKQKDLNSED